MKILERLLLITIIIASSCQSGDDKKAGVEETTLHTDSSEVEKIDTVLSGETISFFNESGFSEFAKTKSPGFDWSKFRMTNTWKDTPMVVNFNPPPLYYDLYKPLLKYSPDSTMFIDLDSYNIKIERNKGKLTGIEVGPDTEVSLIDTKDKKKTRLVFLGPGSSVEDGSWIDNENLVLMGFQETGDQSANEGNPLPVIWRYHLPTTTFYMYEMPDTQIAKQLMGEWRKQRLKGIQLRN